MAGKLAREGREDALDARRVGGAELLDVVAVQREDVALDPVHLAEVPLGKVRPHRLGHAPHQHVLPEQSLRLAVERLGEGPQGVVRRTDDGRQPLIPRRPEELLEVERVEPYRPLLRRDDDVFDVQPYRYERACLDAVVTSAGDQLLDELPGRRKALDFVEHDNRLAPGQRNAHVGLQVHEERVDVVAVLHEQAFYLVGHRGEVDDEAGGVLMAGKLQTPPRGRFSPHAGPPR